MSEQYLLNICNLLANNSKCLSRKIGAVITNKEGYIISTGYNGPPIKCQHCDDIEYRTALFELANMRNLIKDNDINYCPRSIMGFKSGKGLQYCAASHAERNAIYTAAKLGHSVNYCKLYLNWIIPCFECCKAIINSGISEVIVTNLDNYEKEGLTGKLLLTNAGVTIREYIL